MDEFAYDPTIKELQQAGRLVSRSAYHGAWRAGILTYGSLLGVNFAVTGFLVSLLLLQAFGLGLEDAAHLWYLLAMIFGFAMVFAGRAVRKRGLVSYMESGFAKGQRVTLSATGLSMDNSRSNSFTAWQDFDTLAEGKTIVVPVRGNIGLALSDRILARAGDPQEVGSQIKAWHSAAKGQP